MAVDPAHVKDLFLAAAELESEAERVQFLDRECGREAELRTRVEALLAADQRAGRIPDSDPTQSVSRVEAILGTSVASLRERGAAGGSARRTNTFVPGQVIVGRYTLLEVLGEGGMGAVYRADQTSPVRRQVALKLIRIGMDSRTVLARFDAERQALAQMDHPNIARVYDGGTTETGQPYFAMELVSGLPFTEYCDKHRLTVKARLKLFVQVCQAVQHAHQKGVIHRDLKPGNVLVTEMDGQPTPKVIDFGVAKATEIRLTDRSLADTGVIVGTPAYMSPEQAEPSSMDIDTRTDIYALGVILYELLAGSPPIDARQFTRGSLLEMLRIVREVDPPKPSTRVRNAETLPSISATRSVDPVQLKRAIQGDLDWIVMKALEKDRTRRYATASGLAADVQRHLASEPVLAAPPSRSYRLRKFIRKNRRSVAAAALLLLALVGGIAGTTWGLVEARSQRSQAVESSNALGRKNTELEQSQKLLQAENYRAILSQTKALQTGHEPGWRDVALNNLARLAVMPTDNRDLSELRSEAAVVLGTPDIQLVARVQLPTIYTSSINFSPDGHTLVTAAPQTGLDFWDLEANRHVSTISGLAVSTVSVRSSLAMYLADGLAVGTRDSGVVFINPFGIRTTRTPITQGSSQPTSLGSSANGQRIAVTWSGEPRTTVHDVASGDLLLQRQGANPAFALSPDGRFSAREEGGEIVLVPIAPSESRILIARHKGASGFAFSPDGTVLAGAFADGSAVLWNVASHEQLAILKGHRERLYDIDFSPDGEWIATGSLDYTTRIWDVRTGQNVATLPGPASPSYGVKWSPRGDVLAVSMNNATEVYLYKITGRHGAHQRLTGHTLGLGRVAAHPQADQLTTGGYTELMSWNLAAARQTPVSLGTNPANITCLTYNGDGSLLAMGCMDQVLIRRSDTGAIQSQFGVPVRIDALALAPTGAVLAYGDNAGTLTIRDLASGNNIRQFTTGSVVQSIAFLDQRYVMANAKDAVALFDLESGKTARLVVPGGGMVERFAVDRVKNRLVVALASGTIASFSIPDFVPDRRLEHAHEERATHVALSASGRLLATAGTDRRVVLRDALSFKTLLNFPKTPWPIIDMTFDSKGRLAILGSGADVALWDIPALSDQLADIGLAWDRPNPAAPASSRLAPGGEKGPSTVAIIRRPEPLKPTAPNTVPAQSNPMGPTTKPATNPAATP